MNQKIMIYLSLVKRGFLFLTLVNFTGLAHALPALQLGPGSEPGWAYDNTDQTWKLNGFGSLQAYANDANTGTGSYAWDTAGASAQLGYLVVAATPMTADNTDVFDITVENDGMVLTLFDSDFGSPPIEDTNSLASHGIFDTYFEIYQFNFDGGLTTIGDTQPGGTGTGGGYSELFNITLNSIYPGVESLHFDLFTVEGDGIYIPNTTTPDKKLVKSFAPFSHDAEMTVPEPGSLLLLGLGILGLFSSRRAKLLM